jgi:Uma2 family endonuclease
MTAQAQPKLTAAEYLALEREAETRSEFLDGEVFAMAGASPGHVLIVSNLVAALDGLLADRPCGVFSTDQRVRVDATGLYAYPDVAVACREIQIDDDECLLNPVLVIEVLSKSTQDYDRGSKFAHYRTLKSLADYVLVAQDRPYVEHFMRQDDGLWLLREVESLSADVSLRGLQLRLPLQQIYRKLELVRRT